VRFGASHLTQDSYSRTFEVPVSGETATLGAAYDFATGGRFEVGGGFMFTPVFGAGITLSGEAYEGFPILSARVPSPALANTFATSTETGKEKVAREEAAVHPQVVINATPGRDLRVRLFGGPSFFFAEQDVVDTLEYSQQVDTSVPTNTVQLKNYDVTRESA